MTQHKESISLTATKGSLSFLRWLIPLFLGGGLVGGGIAQDSKLDGRMTKLEQIVSDNSIELNGQKIKLSEYDARIVEMRADIKVTQADVKQILIILQKR